MKTSIRSLVGFICVTMLLMHCKTESTKWHPEYAVPVANGELSFTDLISDTYLNSEGEILTIHYYDTLTPINVNELVNLGDTVLTAEYTSGFSFGPIPFENGMSLYDDTEEFRFNPDQAELRSGEIKSGFLRVEFGSDVNGYLDLSYTLPGVTLNGAPLSVTAQTLPVTGNDVYEDEFIIDISGYVLDFTGTDGTDRNTLFGELSVSTSDLPAYTAQYFGNDIISVSMELLELEVQELRGYFGQWDRDIDEELVLDSTTYVSGNFELGEVSVDLEFINSFGVDAQVEIDQLIGLNSVTNSQVELISDALDNQINITRAVETPNGITPSYYEFSFNGGNSNLVDVINNPSNRLQIIGDAVLNPLGDVTGGFDFYIDDYPFRLVADVQVPFCVRMEDFTLQRSLDLTIDNLDNIEQLTLNLELVNHYELGGQIELLFPEQDDPFWAGQLESAVDFETPNAHQLEIKLDQDMIQDLTMNSEIIVRTVLNTNEGGEIKLLSDQKLEVLLTAEITYEVSL